MHKTLAVVVVALAVLLTGTATAAGEKPSRADRTVFKDCRDGRLDRGYGLARLLRAKKHLSASARGQRSCLRALHKGIRRAENGAVYRRGCLSRPAARRGALKPFRTKVLRRALRRLPADIREYTDCSDLIRKEIRRRR